MHGVPQVGVLPLETVLEPLDLRHRGRKLDVGTLARDRLHEHFADHPDPGDEIVGPDPRSAERAEGERADHASTHAQGDRQVRAHADPPHMLGLGDRLGGQVIGQRPHQDHPVGAQLARVPGQFFAERGSDRDELHSRNCDRAERDHRAVRGEFEERAAIEPEKRDELAQGAFDLGLHAIARNVREADGEIGEQALERQSFGKRRIRRRCSHRLPSRSEALTSRRLPLRGCPRRIPKIGRDRPRGRLVMIGRPQVHRRHDEQGEPQRIGAMSCVERIAQDPDQRPALIRARSDS